MPVESRTVDFPETSSRGNATDAAASEVRNEGARAIRSAFEKGKAFIPFVTAGDPDLGTTASLVRALADAGAAVIELGIPFSDPTAEGPVIQEANVRSLSGGTTTDKVLKLVGDLRDGISSGTDPAAPVRCPLVAMTYANVVFHYGTERFCRKAAEVGLDGLILPDVPYEEKDEFAGICKKHGLALISMIAPTSDERIEMIASGAEGFIYLVSSLGVTGVRSNFTTDLGAIVEKIREVTDVPVAIGFGISTPEQARNMAETADGAIIGSAIVKMVAEYGADAVSHVRDYAEDIVSAVSEADDKTLDSNTRP